MKIIQKELFAQQYEDVGIKVPSIPQDMRRYRGEEFPTGTLVFPYTYEQKNKAGKTLVSVPNVSLLRYYIRDGKIWWRPRQMGKFYLYDHMLIAIEKGPEVADAIVEVCGRQGVTGERIMREAKKVKEDAEEARIQRLLLGR